MRRDQLHVPKDEKTLADHPAMRLLSSWTARFVVPALANGAAGVEMKARRWVEEGSPRRRALQAKVAAEPLGALVALAGAGYLLAFVTRPRRARSR